MSQASITKNTAALVVLSSMIGCTAQAPNPQKISPHTETAERCEKLCSPYRAELFDTTYGNCWCSVRLVRGSQ